MRNRTLFWAAIGAAGLAVVGGVEMLCGVRWVRGGLGLADQGGGFCSSAMLWAAETPGQPPGPEPKPQSPAQTKAKLLPLPTPEEIRRAEKAVEEVFGRDMAKAKTASDKAKLAGEILKTAREEKDQAVRFVLAQRAKQLAVQAQDSKLAVQAAEMLAEFEPEGGPLSPKQAADKAHGLWAKSELSKGPERLARRMEAAELYLRAFEELEGFEKAIARNRLKELGWTGRQYLSPEKVVEMFKIPNATINGNEIIWESKREWLTAEFFGKPPIEFGFEIQAPRDHVIRLGIDNKWYSFVRGPEGRSSSWRHTDFHGTYRPIQLDNRGITPGWHSMHIVVRDGTLEVYYDEEKVDLLPLPVQHPNNSKIRVGFGDHQSRVSIRHVFFIANPLD